MKAYRLRKRVGDGGLAHRVLTIAMDRHPWYDWGHKFMVLFGQRGAARSRPLVSLRRRQ